jgi:peptidoglycan/xylan/chitin deacetylase (PgdA/CDA1 family)
VGAPALLALFRDAGIKATYFSTSEVAERYPQSIVELLAEGHELGCHGVTHTAFDAMREETARWEITHSAAVLREFSPVRCFRAPYLRFPERFVSLLEDANFELDSSLAKYKRSYRAPRVPTILTRIPASVTSSVLRLPSVVRNRWLGALRGPVVLFVHPWEFVDLRHEKLRYDCRFRTGETALECLRDVIRFFAARDAEFVRMDRFLDAA